MESIASFAPLITFLIIAATLGIGAFVVKTKLSSLSRKMFGTDSLLDGINEQKRNQSESPKSVHAMTSVYLPLIQKDFPEFDYELYKNKAESVLRGYFAAISTKNVNALTEECSPNLKNSVQSIIEELNVRNVNHIISETVIHDTQIARYIKNGSTVTILFNSAVGQYSYLEDIDTGKIVVGDSQNKRQTIYDVGLVYVQDASKMSNQAGAMGVNCPNCGAPITNLGNKFCKFCGTAITEVNLRSWKFDSVKEQTALKKLY